MVTRALTVLQEERLSELKKSGRLQVVPVDDRRAQAFMDAAADRLEQCELVTSPVVRYGVAYDAAHNVGEGLLSLYGLRTANRAGQHQAVGLFLEAVFNEPPAQQAAKAFDRLRRARNQSHYEAVPVGAAEADLAVAVATELLNAAKRLLH